METAKSIREDFLQQNAFRDDDQFSSLKEQDLLLKTILLFHDTAIKAFTQGASLKAIMAAPVRERIARAKYLSLEDIAAFDDIASDIETQLVAENPAGVPAAVAEGGER